jgi:hypothetical protein
MSKSKRVISAVLLTMVLAAVIVADGLQLFSGSPTGDVEYTEAGLPSPHLMAKHYTPDGKFLGCWDPGANCVVLPLPLGKSEVTFSSEGVHVQ